jgi:hypothetical protein
MMTRNEQAEGTVQNPPQQSRRRQILRGVAVATATAALTVGLALAGGQHWARHHLDAWDAWVAIGTIGLAVATTYLARQTHDEVKAATRDLDLTQRSFETSTRPVLVDVPLGVFVERWQDVSAGIQQRQEDRGQVVVLMSPGELYCSLPIRNVGAGLALVRAKAISWAAREVPWSSEVPGAIPPNEIVNAHFRGPVANTETLESVKGIETFQITIDYSDLAAVRVSTTVFLVSRVPHVTSGWAVVEVRLYDGGQHPYVTLSPRT